MPQVASETNLQAKRGRIIGIALVAVLVVLVGVMTWWMASEQRKAEQQKAFDTVKARAEKLEQRSKFADEAAVIKSYLDTNPPVQYAKELQPVIATAYLNAQKYSDAITWLKKAEADGGSEDLAVLHGLAMAYEGSGDKAQAVSYYKKAIEVSKRQGGVLTERRQAHDQAKIKTLEGSQ